MKFPYWIVAGIASWFGAAGLPAFAQPVGTAFTYQGELKASGTPATGLYDLRFRLYDAVGGGAQVGPTLCSNNTALAGGRFTVELDFLAAFAGQQRFLEIDVRADTGLDCANAAGFTTLGPRQPLTAAPYSLFALNAATAANATQLNGQAAGFYQNAANLSSGTVPSARLSGAYSGALTLSNASNAFSGSGAGLTSLNAASLTSGTVPDARLSTNVALLNTAQTFSAGKTFSIAPSFTAVGPPFSVSSITVVNNLNADRLDGLDSTAFLQAIPVPLLLSGSNAGAIIQGQNASTAGGAGGVVGRSTAATGTTNGVFGQSDSTSGLGVFGWATAANGTTYGVLGQSGSPAGRGVFGWAMATSGATYGVHGLTSSSSANGGASGVLGEANGTSGFVYGVTGRSNSSPDGTGVLGYATGALGGTRGVYGISESSTGRGVEGSATAASGESFGVFGRSVSNEGTGVIGYATATSGVTFGTGGRSDSTSGRGIIGLAFSDSGTTFGVYGESHSPSGTAVFGEAFSDSGSTRGGSFESHSISGRGVYGLADAGTGNTFGVYGQSSSTSGAGVFGWATAASGNTYGVHGSAASTTGRAVSGLATSTAGAAYGGHFESTSTSGVGVHGRASAATGTTYGVLGLAVTSGAGYGVYSAGDMGASGVKPFRIDHPADPTNKYLLHYAAESPEVMNFYSGTVFLDSAGRAEVALPAYFARVNKDPRYTLTAVGAPMPMLHVAREIDGASLRAGEQAAPEEAAPGCSFQIAGGAPGAKVSWRVEAVRNDLWVRRRGMPVEVEKLGLERGTYQHPELYGQPQEMGVRYEAAGVEPG